MKKLKLAIAILLIAAGLFLLGVAARNAGLLGGIFAKKPELNIYVASDLHYLSPKLTDNGEYFKRMIESSDAKAMEYSEEIVEAMVGQMIKAKPDVLVLTGDLTFNGEKQSHTDLVEKLQRLENAGVTVLVIPGNHDLYSDTAASFQGNSYTLVETADADEFAKIYANFGYDEALARDPDSLSYVYEISPQMWMLFVDVNTKDSPGGLTFETYNWIEAQLKKAKEAGVQVITASHQNLMTHNPLFILGYLILGHEELTELYEEYGVLCNLSGHMHIQHISETESGLTEIASSALSVFPCQFGVLEVHKESLEYHTVHTKFEHQAEAEEFMRAGAMKSITRRAPEASDEQREFYVKLNMAYFAGRTDAVEWSDEIYEALKSQLSFSAMFLETIYDDGFKNHTVKSIPR